MNQFRVFIILHTVLLSVLFFSMSVVAEETLAPRFNITNQEIVQGSIGYVDIQVFDMPLFSAFELSVFYDQDAFSIYNVETYYTLNNINGIQKVINTNNAGEIKIIAASPKNFSISGTIFRLYFQTTFETKLKTYPIMLALGNVYNEDFEAISVTSNQGIIEVKAYVAPSQTIQYDVSISQSNVYQDDTFVFTVNANQMYQLAASNFEFYYDQRYLEVVSVDLGSTLRQSGMISDINITTNGFILVAFASPTGIQNAYPLIQVEFKVLVNEDVSSQIMFTAKSSFSQNLVAIGSNQSTQSITINKKEELISYPTMFIESYEGAYQEPFHLKVGLESHSNLAAGDFTISYDPLKLEITDIETLFDGYLVYNHKPLEGKITFSIISTTGLIDDLELLKLSVSSKQNAPVNTNISIAGRGLVNQNLNPITLSFQASVIDLSEYYEIIFKDYNNEIIQSQYVKANTIPVSPEVTLRTFTSFAGWDKPLEAANGDRTYKAKYNLLIDNIVFQSKTVTYNGLEQTITAPELAEGIEVKYINSTHTNVGGYFIEAYFTLDGELKGDKIAKLTIIPKTVTLSISDDVMVEFDAPPKFTYTLDGIYDRDDIDVLLTVESYEIGTHDIQAIVSHPNYTFVIEKGILSVTPYPYILGDVTLDSKIDNDDVLWMMQYILGKVDANATKVSIMDVNSDGVIDMKDISWVQLYIFGLIENFNNIGGNI